MREGLHIGPTRRLTCFETSAGGWVYCVAARRCAGRGEQPRSVSRLTSCRGWEQPHRLTTTTTAGPWELSARRRGRKRRHTPSTCSSSSSSSAGTPTAARPERAGCPWDACEAEAADVKQKLQTRGFKGFLQPGGLCPALSSAAAERSDRT